MLNVVLLVVLRVSWDIVFGKVSVRDVWLVVLVVIVMISQLAWIAPMVSISQVENVRIVEIIVRNVQGKHLVMLVIMVLYLMMVNVCKHASILASTVKLMILRIVLNVLEGTLMIPVQIHVILQLHVMIARTVRVVQEGISYLKVNASTVRKTAISVQIKQHVRNVLPAIMLVGVLALSVQKNVKHALLTLIANHVHLATIWSMTLQGTPLECANLARRRFSARNVC